MRRADRLFEIIQYLRSRQLTTALWLSEKLEVSERTIYRDIQDLISSGVPIDSAAGVGYILRKEYDLPPLMFDADEITSLVIGIKMAMALGGNVAKSAEDALSKINHVIPKTLKHKIDDMQIYTPTLYESDLLGDRITALNLAIQNRHPVEMDYQRLNDTEIVKRIVYPLGIFFWSTKWTLVAWCKLREDFRHFRIDQIQGLTVLEEQFTLDESQRLQTFLKLVTGDI